MLRSRMAEIARECGLSDQRVDDVKLAVSEAVTNVVRHAYIDREQGQVRVTARVCEGTLQIVVADSGRGLAPRPDSPGLGLGLPLMAHLADKIDVVRSDPGTEIRMTFPCPTAP